MKAELFRVDLETGELVTLDGGRYLVNPADLPICSTWTPTAQLEINIIKGYITNLECDAIIKLR